MHQNQDASPFADCLHVQIAKKMLHAVAYLIVTQSLMRKGHGEMRILKRIKRAASQNEVISVNERKYVESLMEKFLRASQKKQEPPKSIEEPILIQQAKPAPQEHVVVKKRHIPIKKILMLGIIATVVAAYVSADSLV